jgi:hypothetical protein
MKFRTHTSHLAELWFFDILTFIFVKSKREEKKTLDRMVASIPQI